MSSLFDANDTAANLMDPSEAVNMVKDRKGGGGGFGIRMLSSVQCNDFD